MKKILVAGGAGFIGSHLCRRLLLKGHEVICLDNLFTTDRSNIYDLLGNPKFSFVLHDISLPFMVQVDEIYNLACPNAVRYKEKNPVETLKTLILGAMNMLELASKIRAKIMNFSTSKVYGKNLTFAPKEDYIGWIDPIGEDSAYNEGKRVSESLFMNYHREYGTDIKIARIFTTYGPNMSSEDGKLMSSFILRALNNKALVIYGDGEKKRSLQYIDDLIDAILLLMGTNGFAGPVNIGGTYDVTTKELAEKIIKICKSKSRIIYQDTELSNPVIKSDEGGMRADITLAKQGLGREPKISLDEGLKKTINYFKAQKMS